MYLVTLEMAKKHLIDTPPEDDSYITDLIDVAYLSCKNYCRNRTWVDQSGVTGTMDFADDTISGYTIPLAVKHATLLMVGTFYANRESISYGTPKKVPHNYEDLLNPYVDYTVVFDSEQTNEYYSNLYGWMPFI